MAEPPVDTAEAERTIAALRRGVADGALVALGKRGQAVLLAALDAARAAAGRGSDAELDRNRRLAARIAAGSDECPLDEVIEFAQRLGHAHLDVPGPRAAQLADELVAARAEVERLRAQRDAVLAVCADLDREADMTTLPFAGSALVPYAVLARDAAARTREALGVTDG